MDLLKYLFDPTPGSEFSYYLPILIFSGLVIAASITVSQIYKAKKKNDKVFRRLFRNTARNFSLFAFLFLTLLGIRYENIPYFSMRIWLVVAGLWFCYTLYKNIRKYTKTYKVETAKAAEQHEKLKNIKASEKYLPNKKKKGKKRK